MLDPEPATVLPAATETGRLETKSALISNLILLADAYCAATGNSRSSLAKALFGRGGHLDDLEAGNRDLSTATFERAVRWLSTNWPAGLAWPPAIDRPVAEAAE